MLDEVFSHTPLAFALFIFSDKRQIRGCPNISIVLVGLASVTTSGHPKQNTDGHTTRFFSLPTDICGQSRPWNGQLVSNTFPDY